jgi:hypothetical protein
MFDQQTLLARGFWDCGLRIAFEKKAFGIISDCGLKIEFEGKGNKHKSAIRNSP